MYFKQPRMSYGFTFEFFKDNGMVDLEAKNLLWDGVHLGLEVTKSPHARPTSPPNLCSFSSSGIQDIAFHLCSRWLRGGCLSQNDFQTREYATFCGNLHLCGTSSSSGS